MTGSDMNRLGEGLAAVAGMIAVALLVFVPLGTCLLIGIDIGDTTVRNQAIEAGVAEYVLVDKATGRTEFQWMKGKQ